MARTIRSSVVLLALLLAGPAAAQTFPTGDQVLKSLWDEGMDRSRVYPLAQTLMDSIGPRVTGTPALQAAHDWLLARYRDWGIEAENVRYGTWKGWRPGATHVDLLEPRVRTLDAALLGWSPGTDGPVDGDVVLLPEPGADVELWRERATGSFVLVSPPEPTCRPLDVWQEHGDEELVDGILADRADARQEFNARMRTLADGERALLRVLAGLDVAGILTSNWTGGYGARRLYGDRVGAAPVLSLSCEDFGLLYRLAEAGQGPVLRVDARVEMLGDVPQYNTVATIPGTERPDEYVLLSAHLDSWGGGSAATDNGTGTVIVAEAMRLLRTAYPAPKRTIIAGHWGGEEQGLNGSRAFAADRPEVVEGLQALFNQDSGTGKVSEVDMQGLLDAGAHFARWLGALPDELTSRIEVHYPGAPSRGSSDFAAFICAGAPAFAIWNEPWDYEQYTWHSNLDTLDKVAFDNVRHNAVLFAMLAYMASEDPELVGRDRRSVLPRSRRTGRAMEWPTCRQPDRSWEGYGIGR